MNVCEDYQEAGMWPVDSRQENPRFRVGVHGVLFDSSRVTES